jgi:hypothetical protein
MEDIRVATAALPDEDFHSDESLGGRQHAMTPTAAQFEEHDSTLPENRH